MSHTPGMVAARSAWGISLWAAGTAIGLVALGGCGNNPPTIPAEYLNSGSGCDCGQSAYPEGPYGIAEGDTLRNLKFPKGWMDPNAAGYDTEQLSPIALGAFHEDTSATVLLLNSSAIWCQACKVEHSTLNEEYETRAGRGFRVLSALFQNAAGDPAEVSDLVAWTEAFESQYPMALDPEGLFGSADSAPLNYIIDTETMEILRIFVGDQAQAMWAYIDEALDARQ